MSRLHFERAKVLIWGKTYPELSTKYAETVCTAGVREDGSPIRLYPVPLRYLDSNAQYATYDWIDVPICKSHIDTRPESFKVDAANIRKIGHVDPDKSGWAGRANYIFKDPSWQFANMDELRAAETAKQHSLGIIRPGSVEGVTVKHRTARDRAAYEARILELQSQKDLFRAEYKELGFRPFEVRLSWRCEPRCEQCARAPHDMSVLDWGLMELARKNDWDAELAKAKLETLAGSDFDFQLFLGNMKNHPKSFVVVGLWYPKATEQTRLL